jgi:hypothetical protein
VHQNFAVTRWLLEHGADVGGSFWSFAMRNFSATQFAELVDVANTSASNKGNSA